MKLDLTQGEVKEKAASWSFITQNQGRDEDSGKRWWPTHCVWSPCTWCVQLVLVPQDMGLSVYCHILAWQLFPFSSLVLTFSPTVKDCLWHGQIGCAFQVGLAASIASVVHSTQPQRFSSSVGFCKLGVLGF